MQLVADIVVGVVALLHVHFLVLGPSGNGIKTFFLLHRNRRIYGAATASRKILFVQALPAAIGLALLPLS